MVATTWPKHKKNAHDFLWCSCSYICIASVLSAEANGKKLRNKACHVYKTDGVDAIPSHPFPLTLIKTPMVPAIYIYFSLFFAIFSTTILIIFRIFLFALCVGPVFLLLFVSVLFFALSLSPYHPSNLLRASFSTSIHPLCCMHENRACSTRDAGHTHAYTYTRARTFGRPCQLYRASSTLSCFPS